LLGLLVIAFVVAGAGSAAAGIQSAVPPVRGLVDTGVASGDIDALLPSGYRNPRSAQAAVAWALGQVGVARDAGYCMRFVNLAYGRGSGPPSAYLVWTRSDPSLHRASWDAPRGAVVVWSSAIGEGHGHIGVALGDGRMVSTTDSRVSVLPIRGYADDAYLGWMPPYFYM
jgi:cell wall-associated NlpC family hydrolase